MKDAKSIIIMPEISPICTELLSEIFKIRNIHLKVFSLQALVMKTSKNELWKEEYVSYFANEVTCYLKTLEQTQDIKILFFAWDKVFSNSQYVDQCKLLLQKAGHEKIDFLSLGITRWSWKGMFLFTPKFLKQVFMALLYADVLSRSMHAIRPIERIENSTELLLHVWLDHAKKNIREQKVDALATDLASIVIDYDFLKKKNSVSPIIGFIGELDSKEASYHLSFLEAIKQHGCKLFLPSSIHPLMYHLIAEQERVLSIPTLQWKKVLIDKIYNKIEVILETILEATEYSGEIPSYLEPKKAFKKASALITSEKKDNTIQLLLLEMMELTESGATMISCEGSLMKQSNNPTKLAMKKVTKLYPEVNITKLEFHSTQMESNISRLQQLLKTIQKKAGVKIQETAM